MLSISVVGPLISGMGSIHRRAARMWKGQPTRTGGGFRNLSVRVS